MSQLRRNGRCNCFQSAWGAQWPERKKGTPVLLRARQLTKTFDGKGLEHRSKTQRTKRPEEKKLGIRAGEEWVGWARRGPYAPRKIRLQLILVRKKMENMALSELPHQSFAALEKEQIGHKFLFTPTVWPYALPHRLTGITRLISFLLLLGWGERPKNGK